MLQKRCRDRKGGSCVWTDDGGVASVPVYIGMVSAPRVGNQHVPLQGSPSAERSLETVSLLGLLCLKSDLALEK